ETTAGPDGKWSVANPCLKDGDEVKVIATDAAGNASAESTSRVDGQAPNLPVIDPVNATDPITGTAEPGSKVSVTFPDGTTAETIAGPDGKWSVANPGLKDGDEVKVIVTDPAGNVSEEAVAVVDGVAPDVPEVTGFNGETVIGQAEPNSTVEVKDAAGNVIGTGKADAEGNFSVALENPVADGTEVKVTATDAAGNESEPATAVADLATDTTAPESSAKRVVSEEGTTVPGQAEPGSTGTVTDANGQVIGEATAGENGEFSVELGEPLTNGEELKVTATDAAGNKSDVTTVNAPDTTAPNVPEVTGFDGETVVGQAEPNSTVEVKDAAGNILGTAKADAEGNFSVALDSPVADGTEVKVTATDAAGNESEPATAVADLATDTTAPEAPTDVVVS